MQGANEQAFYSGFATSYNDNSSVFQRQRELGLQVVCSRPEFHCNLPARFTSRAEALVRYCHLGRIAGEIAAHREYTEGRPASNTLDELAGRVRF